MRDADFTDKRGMTKAIVFNDVCLRRAARDANMLITISSENIRTHGRETKAKSVSMDTCPSIKLCSKVGPDFSLD